MTFPSPARMVTGAVGAALAAGFGTVARARHGKPLHPDGVLLRARIERTGAPTRYGTPWLDDRGTDTGVARLSRAVGLPDGWPDILGLALRFPGADGVAEHDLLLATTGRAVGPRFLLAPRRDIAGATYTSLLPYRAPGGLVLLGALPVTGTPVPADPAEVAAAVGAAPLRFDLVAARPHGPWERFGGLAVGGPLPTDGAALDPPVSFDPVLHPLPGLAFPPAIARIRGAAYAGARRGRHAPAA
ncbi:MAG TPA: hypothetical protein VGD03_05475 [Frankiaceae bacterium]